MPHWGLGYSDCLVRCDCTPQLFRRHCPYELPLVPPAYHLAPSSPHSTTAARSHWRSPQRSPRASQHQPRRKRKRQRADGLETIIVTATRRELSVQDIPLNIAAFDDSLLEAREINDLAELGRNVPGLYVIDQGKRSSNSIVVRGLNLNPYRSAEFLGNTGGDTVATYVGEVPLYIDLSLHDIERVEVLLGPQGTLYGAGTLGGAIRYIPRKPDLDDTTVAVRGTTFSVSESDSVGWRGGVTFNAPLGDNFAIRASFDRYDDPGFIDTPYLVRQAGISDPEPDFTNAAAVAANLYGDADVDWEETTSARVGLRWQPGDFVDATFTYHFQNMDVGGRTQNHYASFGTGLYESATRFPEPNERRNELLSAEIVADLGFAELTSATGFAKYEDFGQRDQTDLLITLEYGYEFVPDVSPRSRATSRRKKPSRRRFGSSRKATAGGTGSRAYFSATTSSPKASASSSRPSTTYTSAARAPTTSSTSTSSSKI